jgi:hypothetical protein
MKKTILFFFAIMLSAVASASEVIEIDGLWDIYETGSDFIGSDVTNKVAQGPVVVSNANITVKATQGATVTKDFEVQLGATFTITN